MDKHYLITANLEKKCILLNICDQIDAQIVRDIREEIVPLLVLFDEPVSLLIDLRESSGSQLDAIDELRVLWSHYEKTTIGQIIRVFKDDFDDQGTRITDMFHMKGIRKINVTRMQEAIRYCEAFSASTAD
ncbi:hypothetical protein [Cerasicoccus maritimus]|uniref:hypothetical protein n=1 Tax=Cerasicoccus maritimus TaxID=490089 RepID=UPI002852AD29|nr:hypothetical protein [Cerasicoccus maritimus]